MSSSQVEGIQQLLEAESEAQEIVTQARNQRIQKMKNARDEGMRDLEAFKREQELEYKHFSEEHLGVTSNHSESISKETNMKIDILKASVKKNLGQVTSMLLDAVEQVDLD